jgi:hypothetical protein
MSIPRMLTPSNDCLDQLAAQRLPEPADDSKPAGVPRAGDVE